MDPLHEEAPPPKLDELMDDLESRVDASFLDDLREVFERSAHAMEPAHAQV
jgi:hypothetical protein